MDQTTNFTQPIFFEKKKLTRFNWKISDLIFFDYLTKCLQKPFIWQCFFCMPN